MVLTVSGGRLLDATGLPINPINTAALAQQDAAFSITDGPPNAPTGAATTAAYQEMASQDASDYANYWLQYRNASQNSDGSWSAAPDPFAGGGTFVFSAAQVQQLVNQGYVSTAISAYQSRLATVEQVTGAGMYNPNYVYQRPHAQQQAYLNQRVTGYNTYYYPLDASLFLELFPGQAANVQPEPVASGSGATAISAANLTLVTSGDVGRTSGTVLIAIPDGNYNNLSAANAQLLSGAAPTDLVGTVYQVLQYIGTSPLNTTSSTPDFSDSSQFASFSPSFGSTANWLQTPG